MTRLPFHIKMANCETPSSSASNSFAEFEKTMSEIMREIETLSTTPLNCDSDSKESAETEYQSCIRIHGRPILPPLMTPGNLTV